MTEDRDTDDLALQIREASELLGVPAPTLRSWERRYGLPLTLRSAGGHRRYDAAALRQLGRMRDEISLGRRPGEAARRILAFIDPEGPAFAAIEAILREAVARDATGVAAVLDESCAAHGLAATLDDLLMPTMRLVGTWWETDRCDIGDEEFVTAVVRRWLARIVTLAPVPADGCVLLATGPVDVHTVGLEALAALLATQGTACRLLGPRTPVAALVAAAATAGAVGAVVVSHLPTQRRSAVGSIGAVAATGCPTYYAGNAFLFESSRTAVPGTYLGDTITQAADIITGVLPVILPPAPRAAA